MNPDLQQGLLMTAGILSLIFCPMGLIFTLVSGLGSMRARKSKAWPEIAGMITWSGVQVHPDSEGSDTYSVAVKYTYSVGGRQYEGDRIKFGVTSSTSRRNHVMAQAQRDFPPGDLVPVYYNPKKPSDAVLKRNAGSGTLIFGMVGVVLGILGIVSAGAGLYLMYFT